MPALLPVAPAMALMVGEKIEFGGQGPGSGKRVGAFAVADAHSGGWDL